MFIQYTEKTIFIEEEFSSVQFPTIKIKFLEQWTPKLNEVKSLVLINKKTDETFIIISANYNQFNQLNREEQLEYIKFFSKKTAPNTLNTLQSLLPLNIRSSSLRQQINVFKQQSNHLLKPLSDYRKEIDLERFLLDHGYQHTKKSTSNNPRLVKYNGEQKEDLILITKKGNDHFFHRPMVQGNSFEANDIVYFTQQMKGNCSLPEVRNYLNHYQGVLNQRPYHHRQEINSTQDTTVDINDKILSFLKGTKDFSYLISQGVSEQTINHPIFKNTICFPRQNNVIQTGFIMKDQKGTPVALEKKNKGFSGILGPKNKALFISNFDDRYSVKSVIFCESAKDCLSHFQLHKPEQPLYISTAGQPSNYQYKRIVKTLLINNFNVLKVATDNDIKGEWFFSHLISHISAQYLNHKKEQPSFSFKGTITPQCNWTTNKAQINIAQFIEQDSSELDQLMKMWAELSFSSKTFTLEKYDSEKNFFNLSIHFDASILLHWQQINQFILSIKVGDTEYVSRERSVLKDFNDDLKNETS